MSTTNTYLNPVFAGSFPDPFVLKYCGEYWAYSTGLQPDNRHFGILHSRDLVHWEPLGGAVEPLPDGQTVYWAPEVFYYNGRFYMYYSVGNETWMQIRVAVAEHPAGPFVDSGRKLTTEQFAIDAHVYEDEDGSLYLFYATDYLEHSRIGTGTAVDRLLDPFTLEGKSRPVTRALHDWQIYDPNRAEKGGVRWHTLEGPFVLKRKNLYYQMFSGGNWQNLSYGVSFATTETLDRQGEWDQAANGEQILPLLRTNPGKVIGPGHNSVVRGPDNRQFYCIYHSWALDGSARQLAIDPLDWAGNRMLVVGPSFTPQPVPTRPAVSGFSPQDWQPLSGEWQFEAENLSQSTPDGLAEAGFKLRDGYFMVEISLKAKVSQGGSYGLGLNRGNTELLRFFIEPENRQVRLTWESGTGIQEKILALPSAFEPETFHLLRLEVQGQQVKVSLDQLNSGWLTLDGEPDGLRLVTQSAAATFAAFELTPGWEDLFTADALSGWQVESGPAEALTVEQGQLVNTAGSSPVVITKGSLLENYELVINALLKDAHAPEGYSFHPAGTAGPQLTLRRNESGWLLQSDQGESLPLPDEFEPTVYQQFRLRKQGDRLAVAWESHFLGELAVPAGAGRVGLGLGPAPVAFEMVRVTAL